LSAARPPASSAGETLEITALQCQRVRSPSGDASEQCANYEFLTERTEDGRQLRILVMIDEFTTECLAIKVARSFTARDVIMTLQYLFTVRGAPEHLRRDNGPEFVAKEILAWLARTCVRTVALQNASPWENGYVESVDGRLRDKLLDRELFLSRPESRGVLDGWRLDYNQWPPHGDLKSIIRAAYIAGLDDTASGEFTAAARRRSGLRRSPRTPRGVFHKSLMSPSTKTGKEPAKQLHRLPKSVAGCYPLLPPARRALLLCGGSLSHVRGRREAANRGRSTEAVRRSPTRLENTRRS